MSMEAAGDVIADTLFRWSLEDDLGKELDGWVYIIGCYEPQSIKIGYTSKDPRKRLKQLQTGSPTKLVLFGWYPGNQAEERRLHEQMAAYRMSGEWFRLDPAANEILRGPMQCIFINNALTGYEKEFLEQ